MITSKRYVRDTFSATRPLIKGCKWAAFWGLVPFVLIFCISQLLATHIHHLPKMEKAHWQLIYGFAWPYVELLITAPIIGGWYMMGIKRLADGDIAKNEAYRYLRHYLSFALIAIISYFLVHLVGYLSAFALILHHAHLFAVLTLVSILYGIVVSFLFWPSMMIAADLKQPFWRAMILSVRMTCRYFWPGVRIFICWALINLVGLLLIGIGLFWTIPWTFLAAAKFYGDFKADLTQLLSNK